MRNASLIQSSLVWKAMTQVDRACYVPSSKRKDAYVDAPQPIGYGATISAPHMHAHAVESLLPFLNTGSRVLDIGSGSGYTMAIFWHLVRESNNHENQTPGQVTGIDHIPELVDLARNNLKDDGLGDALQNGWIDVIIGDGRNGYSPRGPYNAIHVGAAAKSIPEELVGQLASPGRMFIPVEGTGGYEQ